MSDEPWLEARLGDIADLAFGATPSRNVDYFWDTDRCGYPWVTIADLRSSPVSKTAEQITRAGIKGSSVRLVKSGTPMMSFKLTIGRVAVAGVDLYTNEAIVAVDGKPGIADNRWLFHSLPRIASAGILDSAVKGNTLNKHKLERLFLRLPPLPEQRRVARILDTAADAIRSAEQLIAKLEQVRQGLLRDLLTHGIEATGCLRDLPKGDLQSSKLGLIPPSWRVAYLGDLGAQGAPVLRTGPFGSSLKGEDWVSSGVPVITIGSLGEGVLDYEELLFISEAKASTLDVYRVRKGEIVFSRVADVGRSVVVRHEHDGWVMSSNLMKITLDPSRAAPDYMQLALAYDPRVRKQLRATVNSSGRDVVSGSIVKALLIPLPPIEEQHRICVIASQSRELIAVEADFLSKLHLLEQGLMDDLLTGRVRVGASDE